MNFCRTIFLIILILLLMSFQSSNLVNKKLSTIFKGIEIILHYFHFDVQINEINLEIINISYNYARILQMNIVNQIDMLAIIQ